MHKLTVLYSYTQAVIARLPQCTHTSTALLYMPLLQVPDLQVATALPGDSQSEHPGNYTYTHTYALGDHQQVCAPKTSTHSHAAPLWTAPARATTPSQDVSPFIFFNHNLTLHCGGDPSSGRNKSETQGDDHSQTVGPALTSRDLSLTSSQVSRERAETYLSSSSSQRAHENHEPTSQRVVSSRERLQYGSGKRTCPSGCRTLAAQNNPLPREPALLLKLMSSRDSGRQRISPPTRPRLAHEE
ncbi:hypothetical protein FGO68_gene12975 [Halteria grandinella]|uniref:Uncharacterized protein n=1 Tax=Halteria grandinella TaxID=5974 RepID=A0A8J8NGV9_HALGN|nr:hypothetical protein FGO68_gene12975 [Halteria grandinella]